MVSDMTSIAAYELPAARAPRSCLKRARSDEDMIVDGVITTTIKSAAPPARRARLAYSISVGFVRDVYADEAQEPEHAPRNAAEDTATRRSGWVDDYEEVDTVAVHDGPLPSSLILSMLVKAITASSDPAAIIPILSLLCQHRSAQLFTSIEERINTIKARIEARGSASLLPSNVTLGTQSVVLLNFLLESVAQASLLIPCLPPISTIAPMEASVPADEDLLAASCVGELIQDTLMDVVPVCSQMPC
ncbi:hypothetical protein T484DRAFT_1946463 [Baffinella frigidus]|nr:hypothetical protein T484DRAFT_1946463 [Cryptophyta sp. CCMP2293]